MTYFISHNYEHLWACYYERTCSKYNYEFSYTFYGMTVSTLSTDWLCQHFLRTDCVKSDKCSSIGLTMVSCKAMKKYYRHTNSLELPDDTTVVWGCFILHGGNALEIFLKLIRRAKLNCPGFGRNSDDWTVVLASSYVLYGVLLYSVVYRVV